MPLSSIGLCDALIITPAAASSATVTHATAGVGTMPIDTTSRPTEVMPATIAASSIVPESRVSRPTITGAMAIAAASKHARARTPDRETPAPA